MIILYSDNWGERKADRHERELEEERESEKREGRQKDSARLDKYRISTVKYPGGKPIRLDLYVRQKH